MNTTKRIYQVFTERVDAHGSIAYCIERVTPILKFELRGVEVRVTGVRQDTPPKMESIEYEIIVDTDENDRRLDLLHDNVKKFGTVFNTLAPGTQLSGVLRRAEKTGLARP
jgi:uncharacterized OsmC-like protein